MFFECFIKSFFFLITFCFSILDFLSVLFGRSFSLSLDFSTVKPTLDVFIISVFKSVLFFFVFFTNNLT